MHNIVYKFIYFQNYPITFTTILKTETTSFKPVYYFLDHLQANAAEIYVSLQGKDELTWRVTKYGNTCYVVRYINGNIFARYTLVNNCKQGYVYVYAQNEYLKYILHYDNNNLHGKQLCLEQGTTCFAIHGKINPLIGSLCDKNIEDVHKITTDLLKWA